MESYGRVYQQPSRAMPFKMERPQYPHPRASRSPPVGGPALTFREATDSLDNFGNLKEHSQHLQQLMVITLIQKPRPDGLHPTPKSIWSCLQSLLNPVSGQSLTAFADAVYLRRPHPLNGQVARSNLGHRGTLTTNCSMYVPL